MEVGRIHNNEAQKRRILTAFKRTVAEFNSEFKDHSQKVSLLFNYNTHSTVPHCYYFYTFFCKNNHLYFLCVSVQDAHEFLISVLEQLRSLSVDLQVAALDRDVSYTCPVNAHIAFQMLSMRTCKGYEYPATDSFILRVKIFPPY